MNATHHEPLDAFLTDQQYTPQILTHILQHWEHLQSVGEATCFLAGTCNENTGRETLRSLYMDVRSGLDKIPLQQRRAIYQMLMLGVTQEEAAAALHISRTALRNRVASGLVTLAQLLNDSRHPLHARTPPNDWSKRHEA